MAADLRGYGGSDAPEGVENYRLPELIEDIRGLIPALGMSIKIQNTDHLVKLEHDFEV